MNSKTLLLLGIVGAVAASSATAQVYSVNAVGYVNKSIPAGFSIVASPLNASQNTLATILPTAPESTSVFKFTGTSFVSRTYSAGDGGWVDDNLELADVALSPGEGFFVFATAAFTATFVGEVPTGTLSTPLAAGFSLVASKVPQAGGIKSVLGFNPNLGDAVYRLVAGSYQTYNYVAADTWEDSDLNSVAEPSLGVAEGVFIFRGQAGTWTRNFSVN